MKETCLFCDSANFKVVSENESCFAIFDKNPVSRKHLLIIPFIHRETYFDLSKQEVYDVFDLLTSLKEKLLKEDNLISGFNIGMNCGKSAGQSIFHCHIHLIPRRSGDVKKPKGGVRHLIPGKGEY